MNAPCSGPTPARDLALPSGRVHYIPGGPHRSPERGVLLLCELRGLLGRGVWAGDNDLSEVAASAETQYDGGRPVLVVCCQARGPGDAADDELAWRRRRGLVEVGD